MIYHFNVKGSIIYADIPNDNIVAFVEVRIPGQRDVQSVVPYEDSKGKFFKWNGVKVYFNDWIRMTLKDFLKKLEKDASEVKTSHLCYVLLTEGVDRIVFEAPFYKTSGDFFVDTSNRKVVKCKIKESYCHEVRDNFKLNLVPLEKDDSICDKMGYYVVDLLRDIKDKKIKIMLCEQEETV